MRVIEYNPMNQRTGRVWTLDVQTQEEAIRLVLEETSNGASPIRSGNTWFAGYFGYLVTN
jgi:predicted phage tail protein